MFEVFNLRSKENDAEIATSFEQLDPFVVQPPLLFGQLMTKLFSTSSDFESCVSKLLKARRGVESIPSRGRFHP